MAIRIRSLSGLGALGGVPAMKAALNNLERKTGSKGVFNVGEENDNLSGAAGWHVIKATVHLINRAGETGDALGDLAGALIGDLSSAVGKAVDFIGDGAAFVGSGVSWILDKMTGSWGHALWGLDQTVGAKYIEKHFLRNETVVGLITTLAEAYAKFVGDQSSPVIPTSSTPPDSGHTFRIDRPEFRVASHAVTSGQQVVFNEDTTPIRPSIAKPTLVIGGAVAVAAAILLLR